MNSNTSSNDLDPIEDFKKSLKEKYEKLSENERKSLKSFLLSWDEEKAVENAKDHKHNHSHSRNDKHDKEHKHDENDPYEKINFIVEELRKRVPVDGQAPGEKITIPKTSDYEGFKEDNTVHVDSFLYGDDEDVDELCDIGALSRNYCLDCNSKNCAPLNFISHSATFKQLEFIFSKEVAGDLDGKVVLDIGSRLGAVLYVGYYFSKASQLIGIEKNRYFSNIQSDFITKVVKMDDRIKIVCDDIMNQKELIEKADVVIMNNVFEFFSPGKMQTKMWKFIHTAPFKKGAKLITIPELQASWTGSNVNLSINGWMKKIKISYPNEEDEVLKEDYEMIHLYEKL